MGGINSQSANAGVSRVLRSLEHKKSKQEDTFEPKQAIPPSKRVKVTEERPTHPDTAQPYNISVVSTGRAGASLTSTTAPISTKIENALWHEEDLMYEAVRAKAEKGYARLVSLITASWRSPY